MQRFDMKADWNERAKKNSLYYIACDDADDESVFRASGQRDVQVVLQGVDPLLPAHDKVLEIGCGIGRLLEPMAEHFQAVSGVDISGEMVRQGRARLAHHPKIDFSEIDGTGSLPFGAATFDFVYSFITFHHIPDKEIVRRYIHESNRVLRPGGIFRFHLFGRKEGVLQSIREVFTKKNTWRGCKYTIPEVRSLSEQAGFEVLSTEWVDPFPGEKRPFFGKTKPHAIWTTARKLPEPAVRR
ncbi:MAG: class I SAM-dependent methyltransferase [Candidatus Acidiferrales bacterium]